MGTLELCLIAVGLAADAFAVSIGIGLSLRQALLKKALIVGLYFGVFQAVMPMIGYFVGSQFADKIAVFDHWIAFVLLLIIGGRMIRGSFNEESLDVEDSSLKPGKMLPLAVATSIDALVVGVSFAFLYVKIILAVTLIGIITLVLSMVGVKIGSVFGDRFKARAEFIGGLILVLIGVKILLEHTGILFA